MKPDERELERRLIKLAESREVRFWRVPYDQLTYPERVFGLIWELESEVNNGGFEQYFSNSTPDDLSELLYRYIYEHRAEISVSSAIFD